MRECIEDVMEKAALLARCGEQDHLTLDARTSARPGATGDALCSGRVIEWQSRRDCGL